MTGKDALPVRPGGQVRILRVFPGDALTVRFLDGYSGFGTHFHGTRSYACLGGGLCLPNVHRSGTIWKGWAPVECWHLNPQPCWVPWVLEITEALEETLFKRSLRGKFGVLLAIRPSKMGK